MTDIIIPTHNLAEMTVKCLESIRQHTTNYRVIWVDNGSDVGAKRKVQDVLDDMPHVAIMLGSNTGFIRATNAGIRASNGAYVCLLNNDTEVEAGWLDRMLSVFEDDPQIGMVGPTTTAGSWQNRNKVMSRVQADTRWVYVHTMLAFFCVVLRRDVVEQVGMLDERYGVGFGDDDDYSRRVVQAGFRMALALDVLVHHHHRSTFRSLYSTQQIRRMQSRNMAMYQRAWGPYPWQASLSAPAAR